MRPVAAASLAALLLSAAGCASETSEGRPAPVPTRPAAFERCPDLVLADPPAGYEVAERELVSLPGNYMGQITTYHDGQKQIRLYSGPDLYDTLEDLDMTAEKVDASEHRFTLSSTLLAPDLLIAVLDDESLEEPCEDLGVLTRNVSRDTLADVLDAVRLRQPR